VDRCFHPFPLFVSYLLSDIAAVAPQARPAEPGPYDALLSALATLPAIDALPTPEFDRAVEHGNTPLMLAAANGDYAELHKAGGDLARRNHQGRSALTMVLGKLRRCSDNEDRVRYILTLKALLTELQGMLEVGGAKGQGARAILEEACVEADLHGQAEQWMIVAVLNPDEKGS
jgi:hypothetical protein